MCFPSGPAQAAPVQQVASPPPPPAQDPKAPVIGADQNAKANASANRAGTSIFRNDLSIPAASPIGAGINIPR